MSTVKWEEAVDWYRTLPDNDFNVRANYFDANVIQAAERFSDSEEFAETLRLIPSDAKNVLDIGAGAGIASYAFASRGFSVVALEPDPSERVGAAAIRKIAAEEELDITVLEDFGESIALNSDTFDVVYGRQVLHHAYNLSQLCVQAMRVLKTGGTFIAVREHVLNQESDLDLFLESHPLHRLYGGENAFTLTEYLNAISGAGLEVKEVIKTMQSVINYHPLTKEEVLRQAFMTALERNHIYHAKNLLYRIFRPVIPLIRQPLIASLNQNYYVPGNIYSFVAKKP